MNAVPITTYDKPCVFSEGGEMHIQIPEEQLPLCRIDRNVYRREMVGMSVYIEGSVNNTLRKKELGRESIYLSRLLSQKRRR